MKSPPIATIDVGTNTTLLLVARPRDGAPVAEPEVLADAAEITRLGRGIGKDGRLGREGIERTLAALKSYAEIARHHGALSVAAVGTEALRRAPNAQDFLQPAAELLGTSVEVIAGDREAELTFHAVVESFPLEMGRGRVGVVDIGGGSTEIIVAERGNLLFRRSLPLGSVHLHERHVHDDPPSPAQAAAVEDEANAALDGASDAFAEPLVALIGVAGTVTSLAAMALCLATYDSARVHGSSMALSDLDGQLSILAATTQKQREQIVGLDPRRADVIFAGALLLRAVARRANVDVVRVSDRGIRWGLYYERAADAARSPSA